MIASTIYSRSTTTQFSLTPDGPRIILWQLVSLSVNYLRTHGPQEVPRSVKSILVVKYGKNDLLNG